MTDQPEALRVADLMAQRVKPRVIHATGQTQQSAGFKPDRECIAAALLLREQHAEIERLSAAKARRDGATLFADGFEGAFIGIGIQFTREVAIYDYDDCVKILMDRDGMDEEDAIEFLEFNVTGAYVGPHTPVFLMSWARNDIDQAKRIIALGEDE